MPTDGVPITGSVLAWARAESGLSQSELADSLRVDADEVESWERGTALPRRGNFSKLAKVLDRPTAVFFLPEPPADSTVPTSFRNAPGLSDHRLGKDEIRWIRRSRRLQDLLSWIQRDSGSEPVALPVAAPGRTPETFAHEIRELLAVLVEAQLDWDHASDAFRRWRSALEDVGVAVLQLSLGKEGIRGFSAWDDFAPLVAVNTAYHPTARIFTLFHEVGHLLRRNDAACLQFVRPAGAEAGIERWCERLSASFLMPSGALAEVASRYGVTPAAPVPDVRTARLISQRFHVSARAGSLRLQELGLAPQGFYGRVEKELAALDRNKGGGGGGGSPAAPEKRLGEVGTRTASILIEASTRQRLSWLDLADHLRLTVNQLDDLQSLLADAS
ncbi:MAG: ImmA/IrrE family metallo-endopeptidase [Acidimicrobiia bacterium]|nr:ImmA/IrrE family metallo-endopeptidase [Acidimicrobiia bacterium]